MRPIGWVIAAAFLIRVVGVNFGLPQAMHQDEPIVINHALAYSHFDFNPHFFKIPPLLSYLVFAAYGAVYVVLHVLRGLSADDFALRFFRDPTFFYVLARLLFGVVLGTASVFVLYRLAKRLFDDAAAALWAALFFAFNYLHVRDSHYAYVDIPMLFSILMVYRYLAKYLKTNREPHLLFAAGWVGVATAFKYIATPVMFPVFQVVCLAKKKKCFPWVLGLGALAVGIYFLLNPISLLDFRFFMREMREQASAETSSGVWHHAIYSLAGSFGWPALAAVILGIAVAFVKFPATRWVWFFPGLYYIVIALFSQSYERYAMPLVPFLCMAIGCLLALGGRRQRPLAMILAATLLAVPLAKSVYLDSLLLKQDTRTEARHWIESEISEGSRIAVDQAFFSPNLAQTSEQMRQKASLIRADDPHHDFKVKRFALLDRAQDDKKRYDVYYVDAYGAGPPKFLSWSPVIPATAAAFEKEGVRYLVRYRQPGEPGYFDAEMKDRMRLVKTFSPYRDEKKMMTEDAWANVALPFLSSELFSRKATGPYLEIYEWKNAS